jgi:hypothetical protein
MYLAPQPGQPFRAGLVTRWVPAKGFRSSRPPFPSFAWRTHFRVSKSRRHGISSKCKAKYGGLEVSETRRLKALEDENRRLKKLSAASVLNNAALKDLLGKTSEACGAKTGASVLRPDLPALSAAPAPRPHRAAVPPCGG